MQRAEEQEIDSPSKLTLNTITRSPTSVLLVPSRCAIARARDRRPVSGPRADPSARCRMPPRRLTSRPAATTWPWTLTVQTLTRPHRGHRSSSSGVTLSTSPQRTHLRQMAVSSAGQLKAASVDSLIHVLPVSPPPLLATAAFPQGNADASSDGSRLFSPVRAIPARSRSSDVRNAVTIPASLDNRIPVVQTRRAEPGRRPSRGGMDFQELIRRRYSVRDYLPDPVSEEALARILEAARLAPTAANRQPFRIVVLHAAAGRRRSRASTPARGFRRRRSSSASAACRQRPGSARTGGATWTWTRPS